MHNTKKATVLRSMCISCRMTHRPPGRILALTAAIAVLSSVPCGCSHSHISVDSEPSVPTESVQISAADTPAVQIFDASVVSDDSGRPLFVSDVDDFIDSCNSLYREDTGSAYLFPESEWAFQTYPETVHFGGDINCRRFTEDAEIWTLPDIRIYTFSGDKRIAEVAVGYDEHGSSEGMFTLYREMCCNTLRTFLPDMNREKAEEFFTSLFIETDKVLCSTDFLDSPHPAVLYHNGSIGVYPYFAFGEYSQICIIPLTQERLDFFAESGTELRALENG